MPNISISDEEKNIYSSIIDDVHSTFSRDITIIHEVANAEVVESDDFNAFSDQRNSNITYTANTTVIKARVKYLDKAEQENELIFRGGAGDKSAGASVFLQQNYGLIRIKVEKQYADLVMSSTKILIDNQTCQLDKNYFYHSLFDTHYAVFYLNRQK